jgi:hypothetical protein
MRQQRDQLYEEARDNPDSEAGEMVRALLLSAILNEQPEPAEDQTLRRSRSEERRQQQLGVTQAADETGAETLPRGGGPGRAERRLRESEAALKEVARLAAEAAEHPAVDEAAVYRRISEIIGLRSPAEEAPEQQGGEEAGQPEE